MATTSFIQSTPNTGIIPFTSPAAAAGVASPSSQDSSTTTSSSYDDGPAETGRRRDVTTTTTTTEHRMYVINRNGSGEASYLLLTADASAILSYRVHAEAWRPTQGVLHFGVVVLDSWIYVIGGFDKNMAATLKRTLRYDPREGQWVACKDMIQARSRFGACVVGGKIWVCGGERSDGKVTASCEVYDPETNEWTKCGMLLAPRSSPACVGYGSDLFCAGGFHNGRSHNNLWLYEDHRWQELDEHYPHSLPYSLDKCAVAGLENTFYFIGGVTTIPQRDKDGQKDKQTTAATSYNNINNNFNNNSNNNNNKNSYHGDRNLEINNGRGGRRRQQKQQQQQQQQHHQQQQQQQQPPPRPRFVTERRVFSFTTSIQAGERTHSNTQLDLISPWNLKLPPLIHARHSAGAVTIGNKIHVVGGTCVETGQPIRMAEQYDVMTGQWEEDFSLRRCDVSNVSCVVVGIPKVPIQDRKSVVRLRWVMW